MIFSKYELGADHETTALLDTESCVSVVSEIFYTYFLQESTKFQPIRDILNIECADVQKLPYLRFIEIDITILKGLSGTKTQPG
jgi:hypothetical protein